MSDYYNYNHSHRLHYSYHGDCFDQHPVHIQWLTATKRPCQVATDFWKENGIQKNCRVIMTG